MANKKDGTPPSGLSRRGFLKGVGAGTAAAGLVTEIAADQEAAAQAPVTRGPGEVSITLSINGKATELSVEPRVTLLDAMRNRLDVTGAKKICDRGTCGACTVLLDDEPIYACSVLAVEAEGRKITTVEALGSMEKLSELQQAFIDHDGQQCGFCTPGFIVAATAFVKKNPGATRDDVRDGLGGNLCRCGTYAGIIEAVYETAKGGA